MFGSVDSKKMHNTELMLMSRPIKQLAVDHADLFKKNQKKRGGEQKSRNNELMLLHVKY